MFNPLVIVDEGYISSTYKYEGNIRNYYSYMPYLTIPASTPKVRSMEIPDITIKRIPDWTSTEKPPKNYGEDACSISTKTIKVIDFYVDSISINDMTMETITLGDGTKDNPFKCLTYALQTLRCMWDNTIYAMCDTYIVVHVSGTLDYFDDDIVDKFPVLKDSTSMYYRELPFFTHLLYDFSGCKINLSIIKYEYSGNFSPYMYSLLCWNMKGDIKINNSGAIFRGYIVHNCSIVISGGGWCYMGNEPLHDITTLYNVTVNVKDRNGVDVNCSVVNSTIQGNPYRMSTPYGVTSEDIPTLMFNTVFDISGVLSITNAFGCVIKATKTYSDTWGIYSLFNKLYSCDITIYDDSEEGIYDKIVVERTINTTITATNCISEFRAVNSITFSCNISMYILDEYGYFGVCTHLGDTANSTFSLNLTSHIDQEGHNGWGGIAYDSDAAVHVNSNFSIHTTWIGGDNDNSIAMYAMYNTSSNVTTLHNCTLTCTYNLPSEYYNFQGRGLYYKSSFNVYGGSIWEGACITGPGEKEYIAKCKKECIESGRDDCDERCKSYCEQYGDR